MSSKIDPNIDISWLKQLSAELKKSYLDELWNFLIKEKLKNKIIYPTEENIFSSLKLTPLNKTKVVIFGQDPYHGPGQANGLAFSVNKGVSLPPSLNNIFKEVSDDLNGPPPIDGDLTFWAKQGVLLLNSVLTVEDSHPDSHAGRGWEEFTDRIIEILNQKKNIVFLLWGAKAQRKGLMIDQNRHMVLCAPHPSPLSAYKGFFGCKHFSKTNQYLQAKGKKPISWTN